MALPATLVWECRASGASDNNGGAYVAGGAGTDYSTQNSAQLTLTDLATTGVVTTLTSVTGGFTSAMVDNLINIPSGTNFTAGFYRIVTFVNSNTVTLDRAPTTAAGSAGQGSVGGALATLNKLSGAMIARNKAYVTGAFTTTSTITFAQSVTADSADPMTRLIGYGTTRGDSTPATLTLQTNTGLTGILLSGNGFWVEQIAVNCSSLATSTGISFGSLQYSRVLNCKVSNFTAAGISNSGAYDCLVDACEVTGGTSAATAAIKGNSIWFIHGCFVHDNACPGIIVGDQGTAVRNLVVNNTGASSDGIRVSFGCLAMHNTIHGNGRDGLQLNADNDIINDFRYNLMTSNGRYGLSAVSGANLPANRLYDGNGYWNNTSGARNGFDNATGIYAVAPYTNVYDVLLAATPYVGPTTGASGNFGLNNSPGQSAIYNVDVGTSTGGTFTLTVGANTTSAIAYNASPATGGASVQALLTALASVGAGNATVSGGSGQSGSPFVITFGGALANVPVALTGSGASLTGGSHTLTVASTQTGGGAGAACRAAGQPGTWPGNTGTTAYRDMGAVQHADPPGGRGGQVLVVQGGITAVV